jgi:hypothetical protein
MQGIVDTIKHFGDWLLTLFGQFLGWIAGIIVDVLAWLLDMIGPISRKILYAWGQGVADMLGAIPVPTWLSQFQSHWDAMPWGHIGYFLAPFEVEFGLTLLTAVAFTKWFMRVIPFIGVMFRA